MGDKRGATRPPCAVLCCAQPARQLADGAQLANRSRAACPPAQQSAVAVHQTIAMAVCGPAALSCGFFCGLLLEQLGPVCVRSRLAASTESNAEQGRDTLRFFRVALLSGSDVPLRSEVLHHRACNRHHLRQVPPLLLRLLVARSAELKDGGLAVYGSGRAPAALA